MKSNYLCLLFIYTWVIVAAERPLLGTIVPIGLRSEKGSLSSHRTRHPIQDSEAVNTALKLRNGACKDSNPILFAKISVNAVLETGAMLGILVGTQKLSKITTLLPTIAGISILQWIGLFIIIFASSVIGSIVGGGISVATNQVLDPNVVPGDPGWYDKLQKPRWNPPGWLFPIMWLIVSKPTQMIAVSRILKTKDANLPLPVLAVYCAHLALGDTWNKVFFGLQCVGRGVAVIMAFFGLLLTSAYAFYQVDPQAGLFLLPTCGWVLVATSLNWSIYLKNK